MTEIPALIATLKAQLRARGKTYADVAAQLGLSEASVKRLFAEQSLSLQRLERVCLMLGLQLSDLIQLMERERDRTVALSEEQERELAADVLLPLVAVSVLNGYSFDELLAQYDIKATECLRKLAVLDRLKLIELLPNNRIKLRVAPNFSWLANGPILQFFKERVEKDFFNSRFDGDQEQLLVLNGLLSDASNAELQRRMRRLVAEFNELSCQDVAVSMDRKHGNTLVMAVRRWRFGAFEHYRKPQ